MAEVNLQHVRNSVIKGVSLDISDGELFVMVGPSGAGKTTLLNMIAGLTPPVKGISIMDAGVFGRPSHHSSERSDICFRICSFSPHISVQKKHSAGPQKANHGQSGKRMKRVSEDDGPSGSWASLADRLPDTLSGGEKQPRGSVARAMVSFPKVLLLRRTLQQSRF